MAKKKKVTRKTVGKKALPSTQQQPAAEQRFAGQLAFLRATDTAPRPPGWLLSPERVVDFLSGSRGEAIRAPASADLPAGSPKSLVIEPKFVGPRSLVERCVVTLAGARGLSAFSANGA